MKSILYLSADYFGYNRDIAKQLEMDGYYVINMAYTIPIPNFFMRKYCSHKNINYSQLRLDNYLNKVYEIVRTTKVDVIVIGFIWLKHHVLSELKKRCGGVPVVVFIVDDMELVKKSYEEIADLVDVTLSYYIGDCKRYGFYYNPNFWDDEVMNSKLYDWCFIGTAPKAREKILSKLIAEDSVGNYYMYVFKGNGGVKDLIKSEILHNYGKNGLERFYKYKPLDRKTTLDIFSKSRCILDIQHPWQKGLSMRPFHAMSMHTKLITTNAEIRKYDFYNPHNIWVMDAENPKLPDSTFMETNYEEIPVEIYKKYSLASWCERLEKLL